MYKEIDGLMKMGPMWDMDWSSGAEGTSATKINEWSTLNFNANAQTNQWYKSLVKDPYFLMKVQERYWEIRDVQVQDMLDSVDVHYEYLKESGAADSAVWTMVNTAYANGRATNFEKDVALLRKWLNHHIKWMDQSMETEDEFASSFLSKNDDISLNLKDSNGNSLAADTAQKAPADAVDKTGKDLSLKISTTYSGNADIYVNGRKCDTIQVKNGNTEYVIEAEKLTAEVGKKNVVEVKVKDASNSVVAEAYITVKR